MTDLQKKLFEFLLKQREELKKEKIIIYFRLTTSDKLYVGFEYRYVVLGWNDRPREIRGKRCNLNINIDKIDEKKYENFINNYGRILAEVREEQAKSRDELKTFVFEIKKMVERL